MVSSRGHKIRLAVAGSITGVALVVGAYEVIGPRATGAAADLDGSDIAVGVATPALPTSSLPPSGAPRSSAPASAPSSSLAPVPTVPQVLAWQPSPAEPVGQLKAIATRFVEQIGTWGPSTANQTLSQRLTAAGFGPGLEVTVAALGTPGAPAATSATTVQYPQLGGLTDTAASVVVSATQVLTEPELRRDVIIDVRLKKVNGAWYVTPRDVPATPPPVVAWNPSAGAASPAAAAVLADPRIQMSGQVRADIGAGRIDERILRLMSGLSAKYQYVVQVILTGHPGIVFPQPRTSNHAVGRAVDIRSINGQDVIDIAPGDPMLAQFMRDAKQLGSTEVGGPIQLPGKDFFSDPVHLDHIHIGIDGP